MPLPLIPIVGGVLAAGVATAWGKTIKDNSKAKKMNVKANDIIEDAKSSLSHAQLKCKKTLEDLGNEKLKVCQTSVKSFVELLDEIKSLKLRKFVGLQELSKFRIDAQAVADFRKLSCYVSSKDWESEERLAFGIYGVFRGFWTTTATDVPGGAGAQETKATLKPIDSIGDILWAEGVLAGFTFLCPLAGIPLIVSSLGMLMCGKEWRDTANSNVEEAKKVRQASDALVAACNIVAKRAVLFYKVLVKLDLTFVQTLDQLDYVIQTEGKNFAEYSPMAKQTVVTALSTVQVMKAILDTSLLDDKGNLTDESAKLANFVSEKYLIVV